MERHDNGRLKRPAAREINGCGKPPAADVAGNSPGAYEAHGLEINECPIGYVGGVPGGAQPSAVQVAIFDLWQARKAGAIVPIGVAPVLYEDGCACLEQATRELEWKRWEEGKRKGKGGR